MKEEDRKMGWAAWVLIAALLLGSGNLPPDDRSTAAQLQATAAISGIPGTFVVENLTGVIALASHSSHNVGLRDDGTVWEWRTYHLTAANGNPKTHSAATSVDGLREVTAVAGGDAHRLALRADGTVW